ncbi:MAG: outer membrane beta-barrel protein [Candidatus Krumholzibacteriota bacterium]
MKIKALFLTTVLFLLVAPLTASAFDGDRNGFMLNLGAGMGQGKLSASGFGASASFDAMGFGTDLKIGGGLSSQVLLYYTNRALWYTPEVAGIDWKLTNGMSAAGVSYFLEPQAPSVFFSGGLGVGVVNDRDVDETMSGFGITLGVGFEFARNVIAELTLIHSGVSGDNDIEGIDWTISNVMVTVSWLAY